MRTKGTHIVRCKGTNFFGISQILYTFFITFLYVYWHKGEWKGHKGASPQPSPKGEGEEWKA